ncbi:MAG: galactose-1-phosphate uridylyltransferase [Candidatus Moranbacteria bacterium]|nr:galactose-1-phosphate uridylyltransferase [Candidatus Moranbacteria bacterium]
MHLTVKNTHKEGLTESELRQDIVTGDWVIIATSRAKRPHEFAQFRRVEDTVGVHDCLFEHPEESGQEKDVLIYNSGENDWSLRVFPNKYPAVSRGKVPRSLEEGPYFAMTGTGYHEVIATRDHYDHIALMEVWQIAEIFDAYQDRYLSLMKKKSVNYIQIFHNHGTEVGASIAHPHSQLIAVPIISPYVQLELKGAESYFRSHKHKVYSVMVEYEIEAKKRVVYENDDFIAFCPFASRAAFEVWVMPKKHSPYFERITDDEKFKLAEVFQKAMQSLYKGLGDPPYNFYLHTAPCDGKDYGAYRWHIEILPHTAVWAGFELSTGVEISTIQPEVAAEFLRDQLKEN